MRKKIIICSIFVLTLLLLMPSIPAIQQKTIEDKAYSDLVEILDDFPSKDDMKHKLLYYFVKFVYDLGWEIGFIFLYRSSGYEGIISALLVLIGNWIGLNTLIWGYFWRILSLILGWGWGDLNYDTFRDIQHIKGVKINE